MEITLSKETLKKAIGIFLVIALFFGMSRPALPYLSKAGFEVGAISDNVVTSGNCGGNRTYYDEMDYGWHYDGAAKYYLYADGTFEIYGEGIIGYDFRYMDIEKIVIRDGIESMIIDDFYGDENGFNGCTSLKSVEFPDSFLEFDVDNCRTIGVFEGCTSLENVRLSENLKSLPDRCFKDCISLKSIEIPGSVTEIGANAFQNCIYLEEVTIPESVDSVGEGLFTNCIRLSKVTIMNPDCSILYDRGTLPETAVIYGYSGSTAEKYAKDWLRKFVPLDKEHDHEFESKVTVRATCTETGIEEFTCYCGETYTEVVPMYRHYDIDKNDCCDVCGIKLNSFVTPEPDNGDNGSTNKPDDNEATTTPDNNEGTTAPEEDNTPQEPEENNIFGRLLKSVMSFLENLFNIISRIKN